MARLGGWPRSATARLALLSLVTILACVGIVLGIVYATVDRQIVADAQSSVEDDRSLTRALVDNTPADEVRRKVTELLNEPTAHGRTLLVVDATGRPIAGDLAAWPPVLAWPSPWRVMTLYRVGAERAESIGLVADRLPGGGGLLVGRALISRERPAGRGRHRRRGRVRHRGAASAGRRGAGHPLRRRARGRSRRRGRALRGGRPHTADGRRGHR